MWLVAGMALGALPNELLLLLFSLLRQKDACRLSQASHIWHQRVEEHLPERQHDAGKDIQEVGKIRAKKERRKAKKEG